MLLSQLPMSDTHFHIDFLCSLRRLVQSLSWDFPLRSIIPCVKKSFKRLFLFISLSNNGMQTNNLLLCRLAGVSIVYLLLQSNAKYYVNYQWRKDNFPSPRAKYEFVKHPQEKKCALLLIFIPIIFILLPSDVSVLFVYYIQYSQGNPKAVTSN